MKIYNINDVRIEFVQNYLKEYNNFQINSLYNYFPIYSKECEEYINTNIPCGIFRKVEFHRKDTVGYIKMKNSDIFLYNDIFHELIGEYPPNVFWLMYIGEDKFIIYKYINFGQIMFLDYDDNNYKNIKWIDNSYDATIFVYPVIKLDDLSWIKLKH